MEQFIVANPAVAIWFATLLVGLCGVLLTIIRYFYARDEKHKESVIGALTDAIGDLRDSFKAAAHEISTWMRHTDTRLTRLETEHRIITRPDTLKAVQPSDASQEQFQFHP